MALLVEFFADLVGSKPNPTLVAQLQNPSLNVATALASYGLTKNQIDVLRTQDPTLIANEIIAELKTACAGILAANPNA